jgi:raffinose synthase
MVAGRDPFYLTDAAVAAAASFSGGAAPRSVKELPASLDSFGWCTWDAFYSTVSARGLTEGLSSLQAGGVNPKLLIIDDGWQMTDVDPDYNAPPMVQVVDKIKAPEGPAKELLDDAKELLEVTQVRARVCVCLEKGFFYLVTSSKGRVGDTGLEGLGNVTGK